MYHFHMNMMNGRHELHTIVLIKNHEVTLILQMTDSNVKIDIFISITSVAWQLHYSLFLILV